MRPAVDQVKDLRWVEQLFEATQELHSLVVTALGVDKDQQGARTRGGAGGLPETCRRRVHTWHSTAPHRDLVQIALQIALQVQFIAILYPAVLMHDRQIKTGR